MSKELEALNYLYNDLRLMKCLDIVEEAKIKSAYECLQQALQRLEKIDNANPSEAFECLRQIGVIETYHRDDGTLLKDSIMFKPEYDTIKQALIKAQEQEKALDIIKEKNVLINGLKHSMTLGLYNKCLDDDMILTEEEFDLLKRYFK